ncbi:6364_t:CDS:1, partial [Cetraspora pellucida]
SEQESHTTNSANKEENPYLQDNMSITEDADLQENALVQNEQNRPLLLSIKIGNNKRNSILSKDKNLSPNLVLAFYNKLVALYLNTEL